MFCSIFPARAVIHPESENTITETRQRLLPRSTRENDGSNQCPVCLDSTQFGLETNCGHIFCGKLLQSKGDSWLATDA